MFKSPAETMSISGYQLSASLALPLHRGTQRIHKASFPLFSAVKNVQRNHLNTTQSLLEQEKRVGYKKWMTSALPKQIRSFQRGYHSIHDPDFEELWYLNQKYNP